jgi:hypothetical protein
MSWCPVTPNPSSTLPDPSLPHSRAEAARVQVAPQLSVDMLASLYRARPEDV